MAEYVRLLYCTIGHPSIHDFTKLVENNVLTICPITKRYIDNAYNIYGPDFGCLKGKTSQSLLQTFENRHQ